MDEPVPPLTPVPTPSPTPVPPGIVHVSTNSSSLAAGEPLRVSVAIGQVLFPPFDAYAVILGPPGVYSIQFGNYLVPGVSPIARGIFFLPAGYYATLLDMAVPPGVAGDYQAIVGLAETGTKVTGAQNAFEWDVAYFSVR